MIKKIKSQVSRNFTNARGWRTDRKIIVIESDDWGSIRMPDKRTYNKLQNSRIGNTLSMYDKLDSLERRDDFQILLEVANQFKDSENNPLVFTLNTVMQNPDFVKIKESGYNRFFGVPFHQSYQQYYGDKLQDLWTKGIDEKLIKPQFHAREHLNEYLWLKDLKLGFKDTLLGFEHDYFALKTKTSSKLRNHYLATYFSETEEEFKRVAAATTDGLEMFKDEFGFNSETFIASNYCWPVDLESILDKSGVRGLQTLRGNLETDYTTGKSSIKRFYTGKRNTYNQLFTVRNVIFEPYSNPNKNWVDSAMSEVENAFLWKKPAIICMHRINFVSEMNIKNRDDNLKTLKTLVSRIIQFYPDIEFMSSSDLSNLIHKNKN
ncbi:hypothetical protein [Gelidibacter maritimus]|uniref:Polysaccharide (De)acetylase n=1 Tax=Gelidibacter maritimus TaxID=2761487 RepID=A0A7W2M626_9FLAO|nr:hypothetical protein [Gelidibacter maritimus]MBA6153397.1 hypothetical protein [Gelidibacter maritimus]